jgi:hypothetical protein
MSDASSRSWAWKVEPEQPSPLRYICIAANAGLFAEATSMRGGAAGRGPAAGGWHKELSMTTIWIARTNTERYLPGSLFA